MAKKSVAPDINDTIEKMLPEITTLRHELHRHAELSGFELQTAQMISAYLQNQKPTKLIEEVGGTGIVALYEGKHPGPSVCFRAELDALPIPEKNDFAHRSVHPGVAHKCGHDGQMAILCGLAKLLSQNPPESGSVLLLFQPAEETGAGARQMLADPKFQSIKPDYIFALHNFPGFPLNQVILKEGTLFCASRGMTIKLAGKTCHAAHPEEGLNPAAGMCEIINALNQLPNAPELASVFAMVTIIHARLGEIAFGTSPGEAEVMCTLRAASDETMESLVREAEAQVAKICAGHGLQFDLSWTDIFEATHNDTDLIQWVEQAAVELELETTTLDKPFRPSEDFGLFSSRFKGAMFGIGAGEHHPALHHSDYDFPDELLKTGLLIFWEIITDFV